MKNDAVKQDMDMDMEWDLSDLYSGISDPAIAADTQKALQLADAFDFKYRNRISSKELTADELKTALDDYEKIMLIAVRPSGYAGLMFQADTSKPEHGAFLQRMEEQWVAVAQKLIFFTLELIRLDDGHLDRLIADPVLVRHSHYLEIVRDGKSHRLSELEEKLMNDMRLSGGAAFNRLFDQHMAAKQFTVKLKSGTRILSESKTLDLLHDRDSFIRKAAARAFTRGLKEESRLLAFIFNTIAQEKATVDKYGRYESPEASRHLDNETDQETVDVMTSVVADGYDVVQDFYRFKRTVLGVRTLYDYDRYAPVGTGKKTYPFSQARTIILDAFGKFSPEFSKIAAEFFDKHWIDADPRKGKASGAFCMTLSPEVHPFIMSNYHGKANDVSTLAHELGHGIHGYVSRDQSILVQHPPLTLAETASVFGEMLLFDHLKSVERDPRQLLAMYMSKIENIFATVFRQVSMYRFEQDFHALRRKDGELTVEQISALWRSRQSEMFGDSVTLTADYDIWWLYITHFLHTPFYVYAYAFGELLTLSLYARYKKESSRISGMYMDLLKTGGSNYPHILLHPLGIDLKDPAFWRGGIDIIRDMVKEARTMYEQIQDEPSHKKSTARR